VPTAGLPQKARSHDVLERANAGLNRIESRSNRVGLLKYGFLGQPGPKRLELLDNRPLEFVAPIFQFRNSLMCSLDGLIALSAPLSL